MLKQSEHLNELRHFSPHVLIGIFRGFAPQPQIEVVWISNYKCTRIEWNSFLYSISCRPSFEKFKFHLNICGYLVRTLCFFNLFMKQGMERCSFINSSSYYRKLDELFLTCCAANVRNRTYSEDVDMRAQPPGTDSDYNQIIVQALEQYKRGDLNDSEYRRVLSEVSIT